MPLRKMKVSIPFMKGIQTKVEHQILPSGDLTLLENGEFNKIGSIEKRKGYSALAVEDGNLKRTDLISHGKDLIARNVSSDPNNTPLSAEAYSLANGRFTGKKGISQGIGYTSMPVSAGSSYRQENPQVAFSDDGKYALVTFVALENEHESTKLSTGNTHDDKVSPTGIVVKKCSLIDRETNTLIASDVPVGRYYGQGDTAASTALGSPVYKYQGSRMKPIWRNGKFYIFGIDAKTTGVTATPYEPTLNVYSLDPTREPVQISNMAGEYSLTATYGTEASLPSGWSIPNKISSSFPYGPDKKRNYGFSFDICEHDTSDNIWIFLTLFDGTNNKTELHQIDLSGTSFDLTSPEKSYSVGSLNSESFSYVENAIYKASDGAIYYAYLDDRYDPADSVSVRKYNSSTGTDTLLSFPNSSGGPGGYTIPVDSTDHVDDEEGYRYWHYRGFFVETDKPRKEGPYLIDVDFYLSQVPLHVPEEDSQTGTGGKADGELYRGYLLRSNEFSDPQENNTIVFESLSNHNEAGVINSPRKRMIFEPFLFVFGHFGGSSPSGPTTIGAYSYDAIKTRYLDFGIPGDLDKEVSDNQLNTVGIYTTDLNSTVYSGGYAQQGNHNFIGRDHLGVTRFEPSQVRDAPIVASHSEGGSSLAGKGVALPLPTNFNAYDNKLIVNSVIHLYDFRHYGEERARPTASSSVLNDILYVADEGLFSYDGDKFWPHGIFNQPSIHVQPSSPSGTKFDKDSVYSYKAVYEWEDARGNLHQGVPSGIAVNSGAATDYDEVTVDYWATFQTSDYDGSVYQESRRDISIAIYRTSSNGSLMSLNKFIPVSDKYFYKDTKDDAENEIGRLLYTDTGELENTPPPSPAVYVVAHKNRLFIIGKDGLIYFSKLSVAGFGLGFHPGFVVKTPDRISDRPMALATMDGLLYIFTKNTIYYLGGEGPDNIGTGSFYEPKRVPSSVGAIERSPVLSIESGLLFVSPKGIYLLDREQKIQYIGAAVEDLIGTNLIKDMIIDQGKETVYFQTDSSSSQALAYDYRMNQWSSIVIPGDESIDTITLWRDKIRFSSGGKLWSEDSTTSRDGDRYIPLKMKTAWIKLPGRAGTPEVSNQGYQRAYNFQVLGTSKDAHELRVSVRYDYDNDSVPDVYSFKTTETKEAKLQFKGHLKKQKCQAIQFEIEDFEISETQSGAGYSITEIALELGYKADQYKNGVMRIPANLTSTLQ